MVVLFTGISGIEISNALQEYIFRTKNLYNNRPIHFLKIDNIIENIFYEKNPEITKASQIWTSDILQQVNEVFCQQWEEASKRIKSSINGCYKKNPKAIIFLNIHAVYFYLKTQEYISPIKVNLLRDINPEMIITLIDDIYDIRKRLTGRNGIYRGMNSSPITIIHQYLRLLDWRSKETMMSHFLARQLGCQNYLIAVKHSYDVLNNLILKNVKSVYLSHPITEVRAVERQGGIGKANHIKKEIDIIYELISENFATFHPTTIDEFRIKHENLKKFYPVLTERWDHSKYNTPREMLYSNSGFSDENRLWKNSGKDIEYDENMSNILTTLVDMISRQVTVRDYTLVEQSDFLVIYRPLYNGKSSSGALEEFDHYIKVANSTGRKSECFVYCPESDTNRFYFRMLNAVILKEISRGNLQQEGIDNKFESISREEENKLVRSVGDDSKLKELLIDIMTNHSLNYVFGERLASHPLSKDRVIDYHNQLCEMLKQAFITVKHYKEKSTLFIDSEISPQEFYDIIMENKSNV